MRRLAATASLVVLLLGSAHASGKPQVILLEPNAPGLEPWPQGRQAVVAELSASGLDLVLRLSQSDDIDALSEELLEIAREPAAIGAVAIARQGALGLVLVVTAHSGLVRIEVAAHGAIAEGHTALRVAELLRSLQVPSDEPRAPAPSSDVQEPAAPEPTRSQGRRGELWVDAGVALSSDVEAPLPALGAGGSLRAWRYLNAELSVRLLPTRTHVDTAAGSLDVRAAVTTLHLAFSPAAPRGFGFALGLGGGALAIDESAQGAPGFRGRRDRAWAVLLSARARGFAHAGPLVASLMLEPGLTVPPITVRAEGDELARLGRPWVALTFGLGFEL